MEAEALSPPPRLAARENPFARHRLDTLRCRLPGSTWEELLARLAAQGWRGAVIGPRGHGKTTLLAELGERLAAAGFAVRRTRLVFACRRLSARQEEHLLAGLGHRDFLLVDSADQLSRPAWWSLRRRARAAGGLVVTAHRPGLLPTLIALETSPALLAGLLTELAAAPGGAPPRGLPLPSPEELFARHAGNLRDALSELYDRCAGRRAGRGGDRPGATGP